MKCHSKITVGISGTFDYILHKGHKAFLEHARMYAGEGNELTIFITPDWVVCKNKKRNPFYPQHIRVDNLRYAGYNATGLLGSTDEENIMFISNYGINVYLCPLIDIDTEFHKLLNRLVPISATVVHRNISTTYLLECDGYLKSLMINTTPNLTSWVLFPPPGGGQV